MSLRIGFDAKRAVANMTGLGNYSRFVLEGLAAARPDMEMRLYTPSLRSNPRMERLEAMPRVTMVTPDRRPGGALWRSWGIVPQLRRDGVALYHGLSNELPLNMASSGIKSVLTMHDVIYRRLPDCYSPADRMLYDFKYGRSCRSADRIVAVSQRTKDDVVHYYGIDPDRIDVVYQGCDPSFGVQRSPQEIEAVTRRLGVKSPYLLQVGTVEKRKNLELTIRALQGLPAEVSLVVVGRDGKGYMERCRALGADLGVADRTVWLQGLPFSDLPPLCQGASVICYPSRYEGFGIPVLEGLNSRRPVVAATGSCLEEAGGEAALYVGPDDVRGMAAVIRGLLSDGYPQRRMEEGLRHAARFSNANVAPQLLETYARVLPQVVF